MKQATINLYTFDELDEATQENLKNKHTRFMQAVGIHGSIEDDLRRNLYLSNGKCSDILPSFYLLKHGERVA